MAQVPTVGVTHEPENLEAPRHRGLRGSNSEKFRLETPMQDRSRLQATGKARLEVLVAAETLRSSQAEHEGAG